MNLTIKLIPEVTKNTCVTINQKPKTHILTRNWTQDKERFEYEILSLRMDFTHT